MFGGNNDRPAPTLPVEPPPPVFASQPVGKKPKPKPAPSFLGSELTAPTSGSPNFGGKTLLGQ